MDLVKHISFFILLLFYMDSSVHAKEFSVPFEQEMQNITAEGEIYFDLNFELEINQVIDGTNLIPFFAINDSIIFSRKRLDAILWVKYSLVNHSDKDKSYSLKIRDPFIHHLQLYQVINDSLLPEFDESGIYIPYDRRKINFREHISIIEIPAHSKNDVYIRIDKHTKALRLNVELWETSVLLQKTSRFDLFIGILYGIFVIYGFIVVLLYSQFRKKFLLGYLLYLIGCLLYNFSNSGMLFQYILGNYPGSFNAIIRPYSLFFTAMGLLYFSHHLFNNPIQNKFLDQCRNIYNLFYSFIFVFGSIAYFTLPVKYHIDYLSIFSLLGQILCFSGILLSAIIVLDYYVKFKSKEALTFLIAYMILFGFGIIYIVQTHFKIIYTNRFFAENNGLTLLSIEAIIMSIAISIRIHSIIRSRDELKLQVEKQKLELANSLIKGEEEERKRVSKELHDSIGSHLSTIGLYVDQLKNDSPLKDKIRDLVTNTNNEVRRISNDMMPVSLSKYGLIIALDNFISKVNETDALSARFITNMKEPSINNFQKVNIYRIIQELVNNVLKHAKASKITVQLLEGNQELTIMVEDNGKGFSRKEVETRKDNAFHTLISRVESLNGEFEIDSDGRAGTTVMVWIGILP